ncbi:MAG: glycosyltransferase [Deltaproteobacteria bacterium]|nr:glycosyltransferase [Deltaproteobacteria bacterium]MBI3387072.1 glycosyltransferase [Deltaproteobacteria bacterium]
MNPRATIIIVNYNTCDLLRACLISLRTHAPDIAVMVVDNASSDGSATMVAREFPAVQIRRNDRNLGFGAANNQALADVHTEFTMLLNPDTRLANDVITALAETLDAHPAAAAAGCRLVGIDGRPQRSARRLPSAWTSLRHALGLADPIPTGLSDVECVDGAAVLLRTEALQAVHGFNEAFFLYAEDADLCCRLRANGWRVVYEPRISVAHVGGGSSERGGTLDDRRRWEALHRYASIHFSAAEYGAYVFARGLELLRQTLTSVVRIVVARDAEATRALRTVLRHLRWHPGLLVARSSTSLRAGETAAGGLTDTPSSSALWQFGTLLWAFVRAQRLPRSAHDVRRILTQWAFHVRTRGRLIRTAVTRARRSRLGYARWRAINDYRAAYAPLQRAVVAAWSDPPWISVVIRVERAEQRWLQRAIESVCAQVYPHWEIWISDDGADPTLTHWLRSLAEREPRLHVATQPQLTRAAALNAAVADATGTFVLWLDHQTTLEPDALYYLAVYCAEHRGTDVVYWDDDLIDDAGQRLSPRFKPDWNPTLLLSHNYLGRCFAARRAHVLAIGGVREGFGDADDFDLVLRLTEASDGIAHLALLLHHERAPTQARDVAGVIAAGQRALDDALARRGIAARAQAPAFAQPAGHTLYRLHFQHDGRERVSIIIPTRNQRAMLRRCVRSIATLTTYPNYEIVIVDDDSDDPGTQAYFATLDSPRHRVLRFGDRQGFNFSRLLNQAVAAVDSPYVILLNNDTEVLSPDWIEVLLGFAKLPQVGAVGARLLYPDGRVQHAGVLLVGRGVALEAFQGLPDWSPGYLNYAMLSREYPAVTGACLMTPRQLFLDVGGFDETDLRVAYQDVDYCLRLGAADYRCVHAASAELLHYEHGSREGVVDPHEAAVMRERWADRLDDYETYNPNLSLLDGRFEIALVCTRPLSWPQPTRAALVVPHLDNTGELQMSHEVSRVLRGLGAEVTVFAARDGPQRDMFEREGVTVRIDGARRGHVSDLVATLRAGAFDLVGACGLDAFDAVNAAHAAGLPAIWYIDEGRDWSRHFADPIAESVHNALVCTTSVVCGSHAVRLQLQVPRAVHLAVVYPGVDVQAIAAYQAATNRHQARAQFGVANDAWLIAMVGHPCSVASTRDLIAAAAQLLATEPKLSLHLVIAGIDETLIHSLRGADGGGLPAGIHLGFCPDEATFALLHACDTFVDIAADERLSIALLQAMAFERPIVASASAAHREAVHDNISAQLVPTGDRDALAAALRHLRQHPEHTARLARNARDTVRFRFDACFSEQAHRQIIERVLPQVITRRATATSGA